MQPPSGNERVLLVDSQVDDFLHSRVKFALALLESGFEVHVAVPPERRIGSIAEHGLIVHPVFIRRASTALPVESLCSASLLRLYRRVRPTIVHHMSLKPTLYGAIAARLTRVPAVVSAITGLGHLFTDSSAKARILRLMVLEGLRFGHQLPDRFVTVQTPEDHERLTASRVAGPSRILIIRGSGVDLTAFRPVPEQDGIPVILMGARLLWSKGVGDFVAASQIARATGLRARFVLAGEPDEGHPDAVPVHTLEGWRAAGLIEWLGWRHDMPDVLAQSHVVCLPSAYAEGIPRMLLEAAAAGRPLVATDRGGCREIVRHGENGLLVPSGDRKAFVEAIWTLAQNASLRAAMGARGREIAVSEFSREQVIAANLALYRTLLASIAARRSATRPDASSRRAPGEKEGDSS